MDAFWILYQTKRIDKITVREITTRAGYNRGTFYQYFTDIYQLLDQIEESLIPSIDTLPAFSTASGKIGLPLESFLQLFEANSQYYAVLLGENGDPAFSSKLKKQIKHSLIEHLGYHISNVTELDYVLEYVLSAMVGIISYWFGQDKSIARESLVALIRHMSEHGIEKCIDSLQ